MKESNKKHIALFFSNFNGGGIQRVMLSLAKGLMKENWRVDLVLIQAEGPLLEEVPSGCNLFDFQCKQASKSLLHLKKYLQNEIPDILLASQTHINVAAIIAKLLASWEGKIFLSEHIAINYAARNSTNIKDRLYPLMAKLFYPLSDGVILVSQETAKHFLNTTHLPEKLISVIYNPIVDSSLFHQAEMYPAHKWFNKQQSIILAAGRLTKQKDFVTLIKAFHIVHKIRNNVKLIILGDGEEKEHLIQLSEDLALQNDIDFPGFSNNPFAFMRYASLFVLSSRWEGFGNVLVEAMACGTPVVSTNCPSGPSEILENGKYGALVPVGDYESLAKEIIQALDSFHNKEILISRAKDFSIENILPKYKELFLS